MTLRAVGVFCEDIREEKTGQLTLIGILPDIVNIPARPPEVNETSQASIPRLGLYVRINFGLDDDPGPMIVKLVFPDGREMDVGEITSEIIATSKQQAAAANLPIAGIFSQVVIQPFRIPNHGLIVAVLETSDQRYQCAVLNLIVMPAVTTSVSTA